MYLVLIAGGHASGKHTVTNDLVTRLRRDCVGVCDLLLKIVNLADYNVTVPDSESTVPTTRPDFDIVREDLEEFANDGQSGRHVCFVYGNFSLCNKEICDMARLKIFLDTDADVRLSRWILRDAVHSNKLQLADVLQEYLNKCRAEYTEYIEATKVLADVLLPQGSDPLTADVIVSDIVEELAKRETTVNSNWGSRRGTPLINLQADIANELDSKYYTTD